MIPFAFDPHSKPPGRTCQGFAIPNRRDPHAFD
jgi:hypothetical protein